MNPQAIARSYCIQLLYSKHLSSPLTWDETGPFPALERPTWQSGTVHLQRQWASLSWWPTPIFSSHRLPWLLPYSSHLVTQSRIPVQSLSLLSGVFCKAQSLLFIHQRSHRQWKYGFSIRCSSGSAVNTAECIRRPLVQGFSITGSASS